MSAGSGWSPKISSNLIFLSISTGALMIPVTKSWFMVKYSFRIFIAWRTLKGRRLTLLPSSTNTYLEIVDNGFYHKASSCDISTLSLSFGEKLTVTRMCSTTCMISTSFRFPSLLLFRLALSSCSASSLTFRLMVPLDPSLLVLPSPLVYC